MAARDALPQKLADVALQPRESAGRLDARVEEPVVHRPDLHRDAVRSDRCFGAPEPGHALYEVNGHKPLSFRALRPCHPERSEGSAPGLGISSARNRTCRSLVAPRLGMTYRQFQNSHLTP